jgi:hypothetical protein
MTWLTDEKYEALKVRHKRLQSANKLVTSVAILSFQSRNISPLSARSPTLKVAEERHTETLVSAKSRNRLAHAVTTLV